jgi:anti-anti-sigma factor
MPDLEIRLEGDAAIVAPQRDLLSSSVPEMRVAMRDLVQSGVRRLVVDLNAASLIDSTAVGLFVAAFNSITKAGGKFSVVHASVEVLELLRGMRIHQHFAVSGR